MAWGHREAEVGGHLDVEVDNVTGAGRPLDHLHP